MAELFPDFHDNLQVNLQRLNGQGRPVTQLPERRSKGFGRRSQHDTEALRDALFDQIMADAMDTAHIINDNRAVPDFERVLHPDVVASERARKKGSQGLGMGWWVIRNTLIEPANTNHMTATQGRRALLSVQETGVVHLLYTTDTPAYDYTNARQPISATGLSHSEPSLEMLVPDLPVANDASHRPTFPLDGRLDGDSAYTVVQSHLASWRYGIAQAVARRMPNYLATSDDRLAGDMMRDWINPGR